MWQFPFRVRPTTNARPASSEALPDQSDEIIAAESDFAETAERKPVSRRRVVTLPIQFGLPASMLPLLGGAASAGSEAQPGMPNPRVFRMYDGDDGKTHFEQVAFDPKRGLGLGVEIGRADTDRPVISDQSGPVSFFQGKGVTVNVVADPPRDKPSGFHWATRRALAYIVQGQWEIGMTDGTTMRLRPGDFYWVEDHSPACGGHTQRVVGPEWGLEIAIFV